jgi:hypothetical protein
VGMLPVIGERFVIGVITRDDLLRVGVSPELLRRHLTLSEAAKVGFDHDDDPGPSDVDDDSDLGAVPI